MRHFCCSVMHALQGPFKVFLELGEIAIECRRAPDENVVMAGMGEPRRDERNGSLEATPDAISNDRAAELLGHRKAKARRGQFALVRQAGTRTRFQNERGRRKARAPSKSQKFRSFLERRDRQGVLPQSGQPPRTAL